MYNTLWFSGSILSSGAARGAANVGGDYSWRLITWLQVCTPALILFLAITDTITASLSLHRPRLLFLAARVSSMALCPQQKRTSQGHACEIPR